MQFEVKRRKIILYSLIISVLLIQLAVASFFYTEYFNAKKLEKLDGQIHQTSNLSNLTTDSKKEFSEAQNHLRKYFISHDKNDLEQYFLSLNKLATYLSKFGSYSTENSDFQKYFQNKGQNILQLTELKQLIDSTQNVYTNNIIDNTPINIDKLNIKIKNKNYNLKVEKKTDSVVKKGLFGRLSDAIKGKENVKTDSVIITNENRSTINSEEINKDLNDIIAKANAQYLKKVNEVQTKQKTVEKHYLVQYDLLDKLLISSNNLVVAYDAALATYKTELQKRYKIQLEENNNLRSFTVFGLMILMFLVSVVIIYYIKQSFDYEKKLQQANQMIGANLSFKNRIIGMLSHEMRAPMQIMNIFLDRIGKISDNSKVLEYLKTLKFTNTSLLVQANQILEYSKDLDRKVELNNTEFLLDENISEILIAFQAFAESRHNILEINDQVAKDMMVNSDKTKIYQLFTNILSNANKFTENGKIKVFIKTQNSNLGYTSLLVSVSDTGSGIAPEDLTEIFKPYFRGSISEKVENMGAGLGLNLCKEIVELFEGEISATSELGKGTTIDFNIRLNIVK